MRFGERLKQAMSTGGYSTPEALSSKMGVSPQIIRRWLKSKEPNLSAENLVSAARVLSVRAHWLATGEGPTIRYHSSRYSEAEMLAAFRNMSEREKVLLRDLAGIILKFTQEN